jgi:glucuronosyltransferase
MNQRSAVIRNQPQSALDRAVYWTEYVLRHNGAPHLRSVAADLPWYQYLLIDVMFVLTAAVLLVTVTIYLTLKAVYKILTGKTIRKDKSE